MVGGYDCQEYSVPVAGRTLRLLGPKYPHALNDDPRLQQRYLQDGYKPYWAQPWPMAVMLAEHVIENVPPGPEPVLELGAGLGIAGLALSLAGFRVVVTDYDGDTLDFVRASAELNRIDVHQIRPLDWRAPPSESYAIIVGAEVTYEKRSHQPIAALLTACLKPGGRAFLSDQNRVTAAEFAEALRAERLTFDTVAGQAKAIPAFDSVDGGVFNGRIFRVRPEQS